MRKLFKKSQILDGTIEAYACACSSCSCSAGCSCTCGVVFWMRSTLDSDSSQLIYSGDSADDAYSSNYSK